MKALCSRRVRLWTATLATLLAAVAAVSSALADTETSNTPTSGLMTNPCNGETFPFTGNTQITYHTSTDTNGGIHVYLHNVIVDWSGTAASGTVYHFEGSIRNINQVVDAEHSTITLESNGVVIGTGETDDFYSRGLIHITYVGGQPVAEHSQGETGCRG